MLGLSVIERLLPHRPPFLMVDAVIAYTGGNEPTLCATRQVHSSEPVFSGAEQAIAWPSVHVIEGLAQSCSILSMMKSCERELLAQGENPNSLLATLRHLPST